MSYGERERVGTQMNKVKKDMKEKKSVGKKKKKKRWEMKSWAKICEGRMKFLGEHIATFSKRRYIVLFLYLFFYREEYGVLLINIATFYHKTLL